jgi:protease I
MIKPPRIAALIADGFQEEECLVPRFALQLLGARVDMVSSTKTPVEIYRYFEKVGTYDVDHAIDAVDPQDFDGLLIPGGAKSPVILSQDERIKAFVRAMAAADKVVACICRGMLLAAFADIVQGRRVTGFMGDSQLSADQYRELAVEPVVVQCGGIWENCRVVIDRNFISSRHPRDLKFFTSPRDPRNEHPHASADDSDAPAAAWVNRCEAERRCSAARGGGHSPPEWVRCNRWLGRRAHAVAHFFTVSQVRVVTLAPKVLSISVMNTGPHGFGT